MQEDVRNTEAKAAEENMQPPVDAAIQLVFGEGFTTAEIVVAPPANGGRDVTLQDLKDALKKSDVVFGIDEDMLNELATPLYGARRIVAKAKPAQDGVDGKVNELFSRVVERKNLQREDGTVDYRELNLIREIQRGTVICEVIPPVPGVNGTNVKGQPIRARDGKKVLPMVGENTRMSEDGLRAEAATAGNLAFRDGRFVVETVFRVKDVDYEVGNISFSGDVQVNGDVMDGFSIKSRGTVTLKGQVGSSEISGENVVIEKGINGKGKAVIEAEKTVKAGFVENCTVKAGIAVTAQSIINSQVECEGDVDVSTGKGVICGGKITAFGSVKAKEIGNDAATLTIISMGVTPKMLKERKRISEQLADVTNHLIELQKNLTYIERLVAGGRPVPPERIQILHRAKIQMPLSERKKEQLEQAMAELDAVMMGNTAASTLTSRTIHPPTKISIGGLSSNVIELRQNVRVYKNAEGDLTFGTM